jgi:hypothetical protein
VLLPAVIVLSGRYGVVGAGIVWVALNVGYATIGVGIMHRRLLRGELMRWYVADVGLPLVASVAAAGLVRAAIPAPSGSLGLAATASVAVVFTYVAAAAATPVGRNVLRRRRWAA